MMSVVMIRARAQVISLGGTILGGLFLVLFVLLWIATHVAERRFYLEGVLVLFLLGMAAYALDAVTEYLIIDDCHLIFDGWLTRRRLISLRGVQTVLLVHEGLNPEWGIETLTLNYRDGACHRVALGPLWRRRDLEAFLTRLETYLRDEKLVEQVR